MLIGVIKAVNFKNITAFGLDVSWSRIEVSKKWVEENSVIINLFA
jgi:hypothetical protein